MIIILWMSKFALKTFFGKKKWEKCEIYVFNGNKSKWDMDINQYGEKMVILSILKSFFWEFL